MHYIPPSAELRGAGCARPWWREGGHDIDLADMRVRLAAPHIMMSLLRTP